MRRVTRLLKMCEFITLNNGVQMPSLGLGTSQASHEDVQKAVECAIDVGYRHIDCAMIYGNEKAVGSAIRKKIEDGTVRRQDMFITTKPWSNFQSPEHVLEGFEKCADQLQVDYIDLLLVHWPMCFQYGEAGIQRPYAYDESVDYVDTWREFESLYKSGKVKAIGVSNFNQEQLGRLMAHAEVPPAVLQIECHPYLNQGALLQFCKDSNIAVTAYSPFFSPGRAWVQKAKINIFEDEVLLKIASGHEKSVAQVVLRYLLQLGLSAIPKSVNPDRIKSNMQVFDFSLSDEEMGRIGGLDRKVRALPSLSFQLHKHKYFPFPLEELLP